MDVRELKSSFSESQPISATIHQLQQNGNKIRWKGLVGSSRALCISCASENLKGNHLFVLEDKEEAAYFLNDLQGLNPENTNILFYPASYGIPYEDDKSDNSNVVSRAEVLERIGKGKNTWVVTYPKALFEKVPSKKVLNKNILKIRVGENYPIDFLLELLIDSGFEQVDFVYEPGQFSIRGGIVDVFSFSNDHPYRIELFGDEIESIRTFDAGDQRSFNTHKYFTIVPDIQGELINEIKVSFFEFIGERSVFWFSSIEKTKSRFNTEYKRALKIYSSLEVKEGKTLPEDLYLEWEDLSKKLEAFTVVEFGSDQYFQNIPIEEFQFNPQPSFNKNFDLLTKDLLEHSENGFTNLIFSNQPKQIERLYQIFEDIESNIEFQPIPIALHEGFISKTHKIVCYTDHQLFERYHRFRLKEGFRKTKQAITLKELYDLQSGDYVTHVDHGIGRFSGLETIEVNGKSQEAIRLLYRDNDVLYVGIHSLHRISKYTGKDGTAPKMNKLGTQTWSNLKQKTKKKIKELAFDLIQLYAKRKARAGFAYSPDSYLQSELEASFMYEDTPDQLKSTISIKEDMESNTPMDRLICGDVGFGKTEIAIRAAFKAVCDNKQVAVLVPTTILSMQHNRSFKERLADFPCTIDYINRFKSARETTATLKKLANGEIDVLIGTHAIASSRVKFKDLGLIIIDEEQKFGVSVKDKLKTLRATVDTLTLTATPIPRTLQFSLMGARDLSIINTPPPNRQPVLTEIIQFNENAIKEAIAYEVSRGGQVYFVNNRVQNIEEVSAMIKRLCPGIRVCVGHGQMDGSSLEKIMLGFINHEYDLLLATTIIESGIDISNANTIIINNAQNFGISDLHQLRGRVGRSNKKGFCYLITPSKSLMTPEAGKRIEALVQFSDLGSGFNIAMKDLDIRGAGNMLGAEQSGFISDIGFEMYQKILNEAIDELRENEFKELFKNRTTDSITKFVDDCVLETDLEVRIPDDYVNNITERLSLYQQMDSVKNEEELDAFVKMLVDRFGPIPTPVEELVLSFRLRWLAQEVGIEKLVLKSSKMIGYFINRQESGFYDSPTFTKVLHFMQENPSIAKLSEKNNKLRIIYSDVPSLDVAYTHLNNVLQVHTN